MENIYDLSDCPQQSLLANENHSTPKVTAQKKISRRKRKKSSKVPSIENPKLSPEAKVDDIDYFSNVISLSQNTEKDAEVVLPNGLTKPDRCLGFEDNFTDCEYLIVDGKVCPAGNTTTDPREDATDTEYSLTNSKQEITPNNTLLSKNQVDIAPGKRGLNISLEKSNHNVSIDENSYAFPDDVFLSDLDSGNTCSVFTPSDQLFLDSDFDKMYEDVVQSVNSSISTCKSSLALSELDVILEDSAEGKCSSVQ